MSKVPANLPFKVFVDDNFHYMDEENRIENGSYATYDEALSVAKKIVEDSVRHCYQTGMTAEELYENYRAFGEDPFIQPDTGNRFSAWDHARTFVAAFVADRASLGALI